MRFAVAAFVVLILLFGCASGPKEKNKVVFGNQTLEIENVSSEQVQVDDIGDGELDTLFTNESFEKENITVVYFYKQGCTACVYMEQWVAQEKVKYNSTVIWHEYNISTGDGWVEFQKFADAYGIPQELRYVPSVFVGGSYEWGIDGVRTNMSKRIDECHLNGCYSPFEMLK